MKKENILVIGIICIAVAGIIIYSTSESTISESEKTDIKSQTESQKTEINSDIDWKGYLQGLEVAKDAKKPVFLYFHAEWCTYCKKLKQTTFKNSAVLEYLKNNFISIKVDTDKKRELAKQWNVKGLPTLWFLESDNSKISSIPGYVDEKHFLSILKYIHTKSYDEMSFPEFVETI